MTVTVMTAVTVLRNYIMRVSRIIFVNLSIIMASRRWCFTLNNPETDELKFPEVFVRYAIWQRERGAEGTEHLQGYIELNKPERLSFMRNVVPRAHFEIAKGTRDQARDYCRKTDTRVAGPFEFGVWKAGGQGSRSDLNAVKELIDNGAGEQEIAESNFGTWCRNYRAFREYKRIKTEARNWEVSVQVFWGDPGTGKSRKAMEENFGAYWKPKGNWWDGYEQQETVIIDEFYGWLPYDFLLRLCDRYPLNVEIKGGTVSFVAKKIIFTSNKHPDEWYTKENLDKRAFARRVTQLIRFTGDQQYDDTAVYKQSHGFNSA